MEFVVFEKAVFMVPEGGDIALCLGRGEDRDNASGGSSQSFNKKVKLRARTKLLNPCSSDQISLTVKTRAAVRGVVSVSAGAG